MQGSIEQKQEYLKQQIINGGFDPNDFIEYMKTSQKYSGKQDIKIQQWSMEQLKDLVNKYKNYSARKSMSKIQQTSEIIIPSREVTKSIILENQSNERNKVIYNKDNLWDYEIMSKRTCKKIQTMVPPNITPQIGNKQWEVKKTQGIIFGWFGSKYQLWVQIITNFTSHAVLRKSEDFDWLRLALYRRNIGSYIPPLEQIQFQPQDQERIINRVKTIMAFMNSLSNYDYLLNCTVLWNFLNIKQYQEFLQYKQKQELFPINKSISSAQSIDGVFTAQISKRTQSLLKYSSRLSNSSQKIYRNMQINLNKILGDLESLSKHTLYLGNNFAELAEISKRFNDKVKTQDNQLVNIFVYLNNLLNSLNNDTCQHMKLLKDLKKDFVKILRQQWTQFSLYDKKRMHEMDEYLAFKSIKNKKKQKCLNDPKWQIAEQQCRKSKMEKLNLANLSKQQIYDIVYPDEIQQQEQKRVWQAFLNFKYEKSINLLMNAQQIRYIKYFKIFEKKFKQINQDECLILQNFKQMIIQQS